MTKSLIITYQILQILMQLKTCHYTILTSTRTWFSPRTITVTQYLSVHAWRTADLRKKKSSVITLKNINVTPSSNVMNLMMTARVKTMIHKFLHSEPLTACTCSILLATLLLLAIKSTIDLDYTSHQDIKIPITPIPNQKLNFNSQKEPKLKKDHLTFMR